MYLPEKFPTNDDRLSEKQPTNQSMSMTTRIAICGAIALGIWRVISLEGNDYEPYQAGVLPRVATETAEPPATIATPKSADILDAYGPSELARRILDSGNVDVVNGYYYQIDAIANGDFSCNVNPEILKILYSLSMNHTLEVYSLNRYCTGSLTASGEGSYHYAQGGGHAVDISYFDGAQATGGNERDIDLILEASQYSDQIVEVGQTNCRDYAPLPMPYQVDEVYDECHHIHIAVKPN